MTTLQEAATKAVELGKKYAKCLMMNQAPFDDALAALAQQEEQHRDDVHSAVDKAVEGVTQRLRVKTVTMKCGDTNVVLPIIDSHDGHVLVAHTAAPAPQAQQDWLLKTTQDLANSIRRRCFPEVPQFQVLDDLAGVISQIDNMTTGMDREAAPQAQPATSDEWLANCPQEVRDFANKLKAAPQPAQELTGCACRWDANDKRIATCVRHQGWLDVVHEWAERAKAAEAALKSAQPVAQPAKTPKES